MDIEEKKDVIEMFINTARKEVDIPPSEFVELAQELLQEYRSRKENIEIYRQVSSGVYRRAELVEENNQ